MSLITNACTHSQAKNQCIQFLKSAPASQKTSLKGLAFFTLKHAEEDATKTALYIKNLLLNTDLLPQFQQALTDCSKHYKTLVEIVEDSINAAISDAYFDVVKFVKAAIADVDACKGSLGKLEQGGIDNSGLIHRRRKGVHVNVESIAALKTLFNTALSIAQAGEHN
ncbi:Plant invertase/pectin methylesterase inhibitor superfamily protein [Forsythia ovata]|uniref:Plant invertase/pectin methylesterase inhibitor superfamily protein n=1 Tax=Forsythia ovata TaxID=205694 RepID=A0ABD1PVG5_9LAMI